VKQDFQELNSQCYNLFNEKYYTNDNINIENNTLSEFEKQIIKL
jgi:hypothetical protein